METYAALFDLSCCASSGHISAQSLGRKSLRVTNPLVSFSIISTQFNGMGRFLRLQLDIEDIGAPTLLAKLVAVS